MASTDLSVNQSSQDLTALLDGESFAQLFPLAAPMRVTVREIAKVTGFTTEDGSRRSDGIVYSPTEIDIPFMLTVDSRSVYANMRQAWRSQKSLIVQTKVSSYPGMIIQEMPHEETPEQGNAILVNIKLMAIETIKPEYGVLPPSKVANKSQASTVKKGQQQTAEADAPVKRKASVLAGLLG